MKQVNLRVDDRQVQFLQYLSRYLESQGEKPVEYTDLIRDAISRIYPIPDNFDPKTMDYSLASGTLSK